MAQSDRQRRYRQRQRDGVAVYSISASDDVLLALIASGRLTEGQALDREHVAREAALVLAEWARRWRE